MSNDQSLPSPLPPRAESFFDRFLQEQNIKWMLGIGAAILLASSMMLVTAHWNEESYTPFWKYLTLLAYCLVVFAASQWSYFRAGLRKTGTMLMALSVLLVPISFLALKLVHGTQSPAIGWLAADIVALVINLALSTWIATRVFSHFLRSTQPTFTACFLLLSVAGAVLPGIAVYSSPLTISSICLSLWALFAIGTVKVNRHVFWLVEERRSPRIFGFFPILLLGSQFLLLFGLHCARQIDYPWWGLGCVLTAIPILLAADTLARVFQQRTGNLVRPLPWSIGLPLFAALLFCVAGVCLAGAGLSLPNNIPLAFVPTLALAALIAGVVARRTNQETLVWMMLLLLTNAYNFSYVFFQSTAEFVLQQGAVAVHESRLPFAFYGLTYLPLLLGLIGAACVAQRRGNLLFARPIRVFCTLLPMILLIASCTHAKALFPVGAVMVGLFGLQTVLFADRRIVLPALAAWFVAALGATPFVERVLGINLPAGACLTFMTVATGLLLAPGYLIDRWAGRLPKQSEGAFKLDLEPFEPCQLLSYLATMILAAAWCVNYSWQAEGPRAWPAATLIAVLMVVHSLRQIRPEVGGLAYTFVAIFSTSVALTFGLTTPQFISAAVLVLLAQWIAGYTLQKHSESRISRTFAPMLQASSQFGLTIALAAICLPRLAVDTWFGPNVLVSFDLLWTCRLLLVVWAFIAARQYGRPRLAYCGCFAVLGIVSASLTSLGGSEMFEWIPAAWTLTALLGLATVELLRGNRMQIDDEESHNANDALLVPIDRTAFGLQIFCAITSLMFFTWPLRVAAAIALAGLYLVGHRRRQSDLKTTALALANWHLLTLAIPVLCPEMTSVFQFNLAHAMTISLPLAFMAAVSLLVWQRGPSVADAEASEFRQVQSLLLQLTSAAALSMSLLHTQLDFGEIVCAGSAFVLLALSEFWSACETRQVARVWIGQAIVALEIAYLASFHCIHFHTGKGMFVVLGAGLLLWGLARLSRRWHFTNILSQPFQQTALVMPMVAVAMGIFRHFHYPDPDWLGKNSLALLLAAGFYFWRGMEERQNRWWLLSGGIVNVAFILLWRELHFSDPQFYMIPIGASILMLVQLLKREIPAVWHDPLRYLGALVILVSPTFHIVDGSWWHLISLMMASVVIAVVAIGLHIRALLYTGTAFLAADLVSIVVRGSIDNPNLLWIAGLGLGAAVVALAAVCENNREKLQQRLRMVSAALAQWE